MVRSMVPHALRSTVGKWLASARTIKLKPGARFTDRDAQQLLQHEAIVHAVTALNGRAQHDLPILGDGHPLYARTQ
jgi:hypothetical protein